MTFLRFTTLAVLSASAALLSAGADAPRFYRGMIHAHTSWSDGRALPEQAVATYRDAGYDFFAITDHNRIGSDPDRWIEVAPPKVGIWPPKTIEPSVFEAYKAAFPDAEARTTADGRTEVRMRTFAETALRFNEPGRFLVMPGCEVTVATHDAEGVRRDVHMNYVGLDKLIPRAEKAYLIEWVKDTTISKTIRETKDEFGALAAAKGNPPSLFWVNHPHWQYYDVLPQDIIDNPGIRFFEVCNGGGEWPAPDSLPHDGLSNDRLWDVVNATRCHRGEQLLFGLATEDTHYYPGSGTSHSSYIGAGWIGVRAAELTPAALFKAMERGDFYAAGGFDLEDVRFDAETGTLSVAVPAKAGVAYTVKFITTKRGAPLEPVEFVDVPSPTSAQNVPRRIPVYSPQIGAVAKEVVFRKGEMAVASYTLAPDDLYVRARVESDEPTVYPNPEKHLHPIVKMAWTQPYRRDSPSVGAAHVEAESFQARYTPDVAARPQVRGAMLSQFTVSEDDFRTLKEWGATVARYQMYPVGDQWKGKTGTPEGFAEWLDWKLGVLKNDVLPLARQYGIPLVVDLHVPPGGRGGSGMKMLDDTEWADFFVECWRKIAVALRQGRQGGAGACAPAVQTAGIWAYDLVNEPTQFSAPKVCDYLEIQRRAARAIREIDPHTPVIVSCNAAPGGAWCAPSSFASLEPLDIVNVLYQFHMYEPFEYTHQKVLPQFKDSVCAYPDPVRGWDAEWLRRAVEPVREFQRRHGARVFVGEFSAVAWAEGCDRWIADVGALLNGLGWDWCYHAFREWAGWSVEHEVVAGDSAATAQFALSLENPRKAALVSAMCYDPARNLSAQGNPTMDDRHTQTNDFQAAGVAGSAQWPFVVIRHPMSVNEKPGDFRLIAEAHRRHPGACDEFWFATGSRKTIPALEAECATFARYRARCEEVGILPGYQQGLTLGHGESHDGRPKPDEQPFPEDAWQVGRAGARIPFLCPRSPDVLRYEREYADAVLRVANPSSYWMDDDLRLGVSKPDGCFCDRCVAAFNAKTGGSWTRETLVARLYDAKVEKDPLRARWSAFNAESLAIYAAEVRKAADALGSSCRLAYQAVSADRTYTASDYLPVLKALSGSAGAPVGIRPGHGHYSEAEPRGMVRKCLWVAREAERVRPPVEGRSSRPVVASVCYEQETYPRHLLQKSPGAVMTECALALASGCDSLSLYWFPAESPMPVAEYDRFLDALSAARPYFERLAASTRRTRLGGVARLVGSAAAETADFDLHDETDFDLACAGIPVTVANPAVSVWFVTDKSRREMTAEDAAAAAASGRVFDVSDMGKFPLASRRARFLDDLDVATGGAFPVRMDECRAVRILPRVREDGRLDSVTLLNLSIGDTGPLTVRLRNPVSRSAVWQEPDGAAPTPLALARGASEAEQVATLVNLGPWEAGTLFL